MLGYGLHIITALLALFYLGKDWDAHKKSWRRLTVLGLIILIGIGGIINTFYTNRRIDRQREEDKKKMADLQKAIETGNESQSENMKQFLESLGKLSQKVGDLGNQTNTAELRKQATRLKTELEVMIEYHDKVEDKLRKLAMMARDYRQEVDSIRKAEIKMQFDLVKDDVLSLERKLAELEGREPRDLFKALVPALPANIRLSDK